MLCKVRHSPFPPPPWGRVREGEYPEQQPLGGPPPLAPPHKGKGKPSVSFLVLIAAVNLLLSTPGAAEIRIGVAVPLAGRMAPVGLAMQRAVEKAVAEANAAGGVFGEPVVVSVEDDGCASATAEGAAGRLIAEKPALVIGHPCSNAAAAAASLYGTAGVLLIAVGPRHPDVTRANGTRAVPTLRLAGRDDRQGDAAAAWLLARAPGRRTAIVHDRTRYAREIADGAAAALEQADAAPVARLAIAAGRPDYEDVAVALRDSGAEAVLFAGYPDEAAIVLAGLERIGLAIPVLGTDALATPAFAETAARSKIRVDVLVSAGGNASGTDEARAGAEARGAFEVWMEAARRAGSVDALKLSDVLRGAKLATRTLGEIRFDANGDLEAQAFDAASARSGRWVIEGK